VVSLEQSYLSNSWTVSMPSCTLQFVKFRILERNAVQTYLNALMQRHTRKTSGTEEAPWFGMLAPKGVLLVDA
jgi:hypothetical protein